MRFEKLILNKGELLCLKRGILEIIFMDIARFVISKCQASGCFRLAVI